MIPPQAPTALPARMDASLTFDILPQPDETTCGPTCLHAVYRYYGDDVPLERVIADTGRLEEGGTLAVLLGCHALKRGYDATIYTFNLQIFDPTWFLPQAPPLAERLELQMQAKDTPRMRTACRSYLEFLRHGGTIRMEDLTSALIRGLLNKSVPILTGLSSTYLYQDAREVYHPARESGPKHVRDDIRGVPQGHFVVLCGYDKERRTVLVADPLQPNPVAPEPLYVVGMDRVKCAILLGILTYDANLLIIRPRKAQKAAKRGPAPAEN